MGRCRADGRFVIGRVTRKPGGAGGEAHLVPDAPMYGDRLAVLSVGAAFGIGVEIGVGGDIVRLAGRRGVRAGGGEEHEEVERLALQDAVENRRALHLRRKHVFGFGEGFQLERLVVDDTGGMQHAVQSLFQRLVSIFEKNASFIDRKHQPMQNLIEFIYNFGTL